MTIPIVNQNLRRFCRLNGFGFVNHRNISGSIMFAFVVADLEGMQKAPLYFWLIDDCKGVYIQTMLIDIFIIHQTNLVNAAYS